jgi:hypothetical protein
VGVFFPVQYNGFRPRSLNKILHSGGAVLCILLFYLVASGVHALDADEVVALKDMQLEWG